MWWVGGEILMCVGWVVKSWCVARRHFSLSACFHGARSRRRFAECVERWPIGFCLARSVPTSQLFSVCALLLSACFHCARSRRRFYHPLTARQHRITHAPHTNIFSPAAHRNFSLSPCFGAWWMRGEILVCGGWVVKS